MKKDQTEARATHHKEVVGSARNQAQTAVESARRVEASRLRQKLLGKRKSTKNNQSKLNIYKGGS